MKALIHIYRLARAGVVLLPHALRAMPRHARLPWPLELLRRTRIGRPRAYRPGELSKAVAALGPSYIKLGQFLATRPDLLGVELTTELSLLRDKLAPFPTRDAKKAVAESLGEDVETLFDSFSEPVAAASIAQVHKAKIKEAGSSPRAVAVKVLRPGVERRFQRDLETFYFAARLIERWHTPSQRLRPVAVIDTLARWVEIEMDLRMEAAALSEMAENVKTAGDTDFHVPAVDWPHTAQRVLTVEWIDAIPLGDLDAIDHAGLDRRKLGVSIIRAFLKHAMRDGFFHADMHQGNLFVDHAGQIVAIDFGIMGRLGPQEKRFLAEILYGFITSSYMRCARVHFEAGYVPPHQDVATFAQALRAIGEPLKDRTAEEISMGRVLGQLFEVTEMFDMRTRPELLLLQKTMVVVEGVARSLDPRLNMWDAAEPVVREWMATEMGAGARLREAADGAVSLASLLSAVPKLSEQAGKVGHSLSQMSETGLRLDEETVRQLSAANARRGRWGGLAIWVGALALAAIAVKLWSGS
ncbi:MAG: 2-polyprenylphenol 6-hydroxylase [Dichotomicrobium sp.]